MEAKGKILVVTVVLLAMGIGEAQGAIVRIALTGEVTYVDEFDTDLNALFDVGDLVRGLYAYDTDTRDSNPLSSVGDYVHRSAPYGVYLTVGPFNIGSDPERVDFLLEVGDNHAYSSWDHYLFHSYSNSPLSDGMPVSLISWSLADSSGKAISSDDLPGLPPSLADWDRHRSLIIEFGPKGGSAIGAEVTCVELIPEPTTLSLLGVGALALFKRPRQYQAERSAHL